MATDKELGSVMAGGMIAVALLNALIAKKVFNLSEARTVVVRAKDNLGDEETPMNAVERDAYRILERFIRERYAA